MTVPLWLAVVVLAGVTVVSLLGGAHMAREHEYQLRLRWLHRWARHWTDEGLDEEARVTKRLLHLLGDRECPPAPERWGEPIDEETP
jgi:hypothetical protein